MASQKESLKTGNSIFKEFYSKLQDPKSEEIRQLFERFVQKGFKPKSSRDEMAKQIREIVELMFENFADVWKIRSKIILEGMEALVTKNLYKIICLRRDSEIEENEMLEKKMRILGNFIKPEHLDIDPKRLNNARVERAIAELSKMSKFKTPRDKMVLIMNTCKVIGLMLKETNKGDIAEGADMFFPTIIYVLLKGCPKHIKAHVDYIKLYRNPELLDSEDDYFLTTITSAIDFISNLIGDDLNIEKSEFKDLYDKFSGEDKESKEEAERRAKAKRDRNYDDFDNQSEISVMTTQTSAQILGELQSLDVPIYGASLKLNKGIQTENNDSRKEETQTLNKEILDISETDHKFHNQIKSEIFEENKSFWDSQLKENFEEMSIASLRELHKLACKLKRIHDGGSSVPQISHNQADLMLLFGDSNKTSPQDDLKKSGLEGLDDLFSK